MSARSLANKEKKRKAGGGKVARGHPPTPTAADSRPVLTRGRRAGLPIIYIVHSQIEKHLKSKSPSRLSLLSTERGTATAVLFSCDNYLAGALKPQVGSSRARMEATADRARTEATVTPIGGVVGLSIGQKILKNSENGSDKGAM